MLPIITKLSMRTGISLKSSMRTGISLHNTTKKPPIKTRSSRTRLSLSNRSSNSTLLPSSSVAQGLFPPNSLIFLASFSLPARSLASGSLDACVPLILDAPGPLVGVKGRGDSNCGYRNIRQVSGNYPLIASSCGLYDGENSVDVDSIHQFKSNGFLCRQHISIDQPPNPSAQAQYSPMENTKIHTASYCLSEPPGCVSVL